MEGFGVLSFYRVGSSCGGKYGAEGLMVWDAYVRVYDLRV